MLVRNKIGWYIRKMETKRRKNHRKNEDLEQLLKDVNGLLNAAEIKATNSFEKSKYPLVLIVGCARSGTTLFLQWLAGLGYWGYISASNI